ncbi:MAG: HEAT repeat domain-containing protein [Planctomycetes bacterium]|nr:HEAT repeat domain-containing protein [Planctomycetota bacterium]
MDNHCRHIERLFSNAYDYKLVGGESMEFLMHLKNCSHCRAEFESYKDAIGALRKAAPAEASGDFAQKVTEKIAAAYPDGTVKPNIFEKARNAGINALALRIPAWASVAAVITITILAYFMFQAAVPQDPLSDGANAKIERLFAEKGFVKVDGNWISVDDYEKIRKGLQKFNNEWLTDEQIQERILSQNNFIKANDKWMTLQEKETADAMNNGLCFYNGQWYNSEGLLKLMLEKAGIVEYNGTLVSAEEKEKMERGLIKAGDKWLTEEELTAQLKNATLAKENMVLYKGKWVTSEEKEMLEKEMIKYQGDWFSKDDLARKIFEENGLIWTGSRLITPEINRNIANAETVMRISNAGTQNSITLMIENVTILDPLTFQNISIYPLKAPQTGIAPVPKTTMLSFTDAMKTKNLQLRELASASVGTIQIRNLTQSDIFIAAGTIIEGGKQDRIFARDTIVSKDSKEWSNLDVFCCEADRWSNTPKETQLQGEIASPMLKKVLYVQKGQWEVWNTIDAQKTSINDRSTTSALQTAFSAQKYREFLAEAVPTMGKLPDKNIIGIAVSIGGKLELVEMFNNPELFESNYRALMNSAVLEAFVVRNNPNMQSSSLIPDGKRSVKKTLETLFYILPVEQKHNGTKEVTLSGINNLHANAMVSNDALVHLTVIPENIPINPAKQPIPAGMPEPAYSDPNTGIVFKQILKEFHAKMKSPNISERRAAVQELAEIDHPFITDALTPYLKDVDNGIKCLVADTIGLQGTSQATTTLIDALNVNKKNLNVINSITTALAKIGDERSIEPLVKIVVTIPSPKLSENALKALPYVIVRNKNKRLAEMAIDKLIIFLESTQEAMDAVEKQKPKPWEIDPSRETDGELTPPDLDEPISAENTSKEQLAEILKQLHFPALQTLRTLTGRNFSNATEARLWWNLEKSSYLKTFDE